MTKKNVICKREYIQFWILFNNTIEKDSHKVIKIIKTFQKISKKMYLCYIKIYGNPKKLKRFGDLSCNK
jgi:hypothetical protein